jgi:hypothetical protein
MAYGEYDRMPVVPDSAWIPGGNTVPGAVASTYRMDSVGVFTGTSPTPTRCPAFTGFVHGADIGV